MTHNEEVYLAAKKVFYGLYEVTPSLIRNFANELATHFDSCDLSYLYKSHDGIHLSYKYSGDILSNDEISDIIISCLMDFYATYVTDVDIRQYISCSNNTRCLFKLLIADNKNFSVVI